MKIKTIFNFAAAILCVVAILCSLACPSKADGLRKATEASYRLPAATNDIIAKVAEARDTHLITVEQARAFGTHLNELARAEVIFVDMVRAANETFKRTGVVDPVTQSNLRNYFDASIIEPFLRILEAANVINGSEVALILTAIMAVKLLLRTVAGGIGSKSKPKLAGIYPSKYIRQADAAAAFA